MTKNLHVFKNRKETLFFVVLFIISIISTGLVYALHFNGPPIRSDGLGYYVYLPSIFVYNDISMNKFIDAYSKHYNDTPTDYWNGVYKYENSGNYLDKYPVGVAVMSLPFFLLAHFGTLIISNFSGIPPNGFTDPLYHAAQSFSGLFYALLGLLILKRILDKYFSSKSVYLTLIAVTFGTNLFHYFTYDAVFSHPYSFFLFTLFIYLTIKWYSNPNKINSILIGITTGLITIVRPTNLVIVLFFLLFGLGSRNTFTQIQERISLYFYKYKKIILIITSALLVLSIQILYWYLITGRLFVYSYTDEYFDLKNPQILNVLFSIRKGFFFWSPILLLSIPGLIFVRRKLKGYNLAFLIFFSVNIYIVSSWWSWWYGGGFGMRALIEVIPFLALPIAAIFEKILEIRNKTKKYIFLFVIVILIVFTTYMMIQYWRGLVPIDNPGITTVMNALLNRYV